MFSVYNEGVKLMALSTMMKKHVRFWAFSSEIIQTNGVHEDLHSFEINIGKDVLEALNDQIGYLKENDLTRYFAAYIFSSDEMKHVSVHMNEPDTVEVNDLYLMGNTSGLYAKFHITLHEKLVFYLVRLIAYGKG